MRPVEGGWWLVGEHAGRAVRWWRNPALILPAVWSSVVALWSRSQGGMGVGWLPEPGGQNAQPAWLWQAFAVLSAEDRRLAEKKGAG